MNVVPFTPLTVAPSGEQARPSRAPGVKCGELPEDGPAVFPSDPHAVPDVDGLGGSAVDGVACMLVDGQAPPLAATALSAMATSLIPELVTAIVTIRAAIPTTRVKLIQYLPNITYIFNIYIIIVL
jgi:hypothetical protein